METSPDSDFLNPNYALDLYRKFGKINEIVPKIKIIIEEFRKRSETNQSIKLNLKNNLKSNKLREEAERYLSGNKDVSTLQRALELYNESICYAEQANEECLAVLYARRAFVYFELKEYEICLENISLAEANSRPENLSVELKKLRTESLQLLQNSNKQKKKEKKSGIRLNVESHERMPFASSCLELKADSVQGRYLSTNEDLEPGSLLIVESPFEKVLSADYIYQRCSNCLDKNSLNLIPCPNCTKAMFCSDKCLLEAFQGFHQFECPIIDCLCDVGGQLTVRTFLKAIRSFNSILELIQFTQSKDIENVTAFSFDHSKELSPQQHYQRIHNLSTNQDVRSEMDLFTHVMVTALFFYEMNFNTPFKDLVTEESRDHLIELMFRIELITAINSFSFNDLSSLQDNDIIGTGMYQLSSLINHSCSPNACPKYYHTNLHLYTTQTIKKGESISISYNGSHAFLPKEKRQSFLMGKYHFLCQCIACINNFPLLVNMTLANIPEIHSNGINVQLDKTIAENIYRKCCTYLREYYRCYPCKEIYSVQVCMSKLLSYLLMNDDNCTVELCIGKLGNRNPKDIIFSNQVQASQ